MPINVVAYLYRFDPDGDENVPNATRNYGNMATGDGWVFGMCWYKGSKAAPEANEVCTLCLCKDL